MKKKTISKNNIKKFSGGGLTGSGVTNQNISNELAGINGGGGDPMMMGVSAASASINAAGPMVQDAVGGDKGKYAGALMTGIANGPIAGLAAGYGAYKSIQADKEAAAQRKHDLANQQAQNNFNANYKPQFSSGYYTMANGGVMPGTNAMIDNNEVVQTNGPINQLAQSNGGGQLEQTSSNTAVVNGINPNQTDGVEAQIEPGSRIFSDKIKAPNGKTYAELADRISKGKSRYEKLLEQDDSSQLQKKTAEKMIEKIDEELDELFQEQEATKPQPIEQPQPIQQEESMMANGGIVPGYSGEDGRPGIIAPYMQPNMRQTNPIGQLPQWDRGFNGPMPFDGNLIIGSSPNYTQQPITTEFPQSQIIENQTFSGIYGNQNINPNIYNSSAKLPNNNTTNQSGISGSGTTTSAPDVFSKDRPGYKRDQYGNEYKVNALGLSDYETSQGALKGIGMLGPAVNIGRGLFEKVDLLDPNAYNSNTRISAPKMNVDPQVAEVRNSSIANRNALKGMGAQAFMSGMNSVNSTSDRTIAGIYSNKHNIDSENQMKADMYNAEANKNDVENRLKIEMINRAAKGAKDQMLTTGLGQLSDVGYGLAKENAYNKSMQGVNSNYYLGPDGTWRVKDSSQKGDVATNETNTQNKESNKTGLMGAGTSSADKTNNATSTNTIFDHKPITASIKAKDNEIFGGKKGVWSKHINGNKEYDNYIVSKMKEKGISGVKYSKMTWGEIKKYLD